MHTAQNNPLTENQLDRFRKQLEAEREKVSEEVRRLERENLPNINPGEEANDSYGDDSKNEQMRTRTVHLIEQQRNRLQEIRAALLRIENGTFGIDRKTGNPIRMERLEANPLATTNIG